MRFHLSEFATAMEAPRGWLLTSVVPRTTFGLVIAVAATLYLSALRRREPGRRSAPALLTVGGLLALGILAAALQIYTIPAVLTGGGPRGDSTTPVLGAVQAGFQTMRLGVGAATSTLLLVALQIGYLDRLAIRVGTVTPDDAPSKGGVPTWAPPAALLPQDVPPQAQEPISKG